MVLTFSKKEKYEIGTKKIIKTGILNIFFNLPEQNNMRSLPSPRNSIVPLLTEVINHGCTCKLPDFTAGLGKPNRS